MVLRFTYGPLTCAGAKKAIYYHLRCSVTPAMRDRPDRRWAMQLLIRTCGRGLSFLEQPSLRLRSTSCYSSILHTLLLLVISATRRARSSEVRRAPISRRFRSIRARS
ncbi:hypothetical protein OH76DRAFT_190799 [Lentinus brumalis]|uniref:Uncharacterized protein n=1 Tax=Lentinus brumalis TaxID=2498619 RepID=A0A371CMU6_9APHY|nr:hypothetical protein OH76DRAFT_190799 [Polyporus brumalis]